MSIAQELLGEIVQENITEARARVPVDVLNLMWTWAHFPLAWEFVGGKWLPELSQISFRKGLNGQADDGNTAAPKHHIAAKGGVLIEPSNPRLGKYRNYIRRFPAYNAASKQTGTYFASMFETPTVIGGRHAKWTIDTAGYNAFREFLVEKGLIESIDPSVVAAKIEEKRGLVDHLKSLPTNQLRAERILSLEKMIEQMEASLDSVEGTAIAPEGEVNIEPESDAESAESTTKPAPRRRPGK